VQPRLLLVLALSLAMAGGAARAETRAAPPRSASTPPPPAGAERVEVLVTFPPWQGPSGSSSVLARRYTGTFRVESSSGELLDEGTARDDSGLASQAVVERVLEGMRGSIVLRVQRTAKVPHFPAIFGRWTIVRGSGAYADAAGSGTFTSCESGEAGKGSELQTLVGHARLR
jgi:hypothetical protein